MKINREGAELALLSFCSRQMTPAETDHLIDGMESYQDLLAHILLETGFLAEHPVVRDIILELDVPVTRSLLGDDAMLKRARLEAERQVLKEMFELQRQYAVKSEELARIEQKIAERRQFHAALRVRA